MRWLTSILLCFSCLVLSDLAAAKAARPAEIDPQLFESLGTALEDTDSFYDRFDAEVWLLDMTGRLASTIPDSDKRLDLLKLIHHEANRADIAPEIVLSIIQIESAFRPAVTSRAGAQGLMQIMPFWKKEIGREGDDLFDPATNLRYGCTIFRHYLNREKGNIARALQRYNGAVGGSRYSSKVKAALYGKWYRQ